MDGDKDSLGIVIKRFINKNLSLLQISGWLILFALWYMVTNFGLINTHVLPTPQKTWNSFQEMRKDDNLWDNILFSVRINLIGYIKCILAALVVGFAIGLSPKVRKMFSQQVNALRFVPITALMGIFIAISGLTITTKINFLAFGIWVCSVPPMAQPGALHLLIRSRLAAAIWMVTGWMSFR